MNILSSGLTGNLRTNIFNNSHTNGEQFSAGLSRRFAHGVSIRAETGIRSYKYERYSGSNDDSWVKFESSVNISRMLYFSGFFESFYGENIRSDRFMVEMSLRI